MTKYYAFWHTYSGNIRRGDNVRMGVLVAFDTRSARDTWVNSGPSARSDHHWREALEADHFEVKRNRRIDNCIAADDLSDFSARSGWSRT